jgi:hypothetical protein
MGCYFRIAVAIGFEVVFGAIGLLRDLPHLPLHMHVKEVDLVRGWTGACTAWSHRAASVNEVVPQAVMTLYLI